MKRFKNEKGAITIIVLVSVLFMVSFLISTYVIVANKVQTQKEVIAETRRIYESDKSMEEIYNSYFYEDGIIPIYTKEQYLKIGSRELVKIEQTNKYYTFLPTSKYILMHSFEINESELPTGWDAPEFVFKNTEGFVVDYSGYIARVIYQNGKEIIFDGRVIRTLDIADGSIEITNTGYKITYTDPQTEEQTITQKEYTGPYIITGETTTNYVRIMSTGDFDITLRDLSIDTSEIRGFQNTAVCAFDANYKQTAKRSKC